GIEARAAGTRQREWRVAVVAEARIGREYVHPRRRLAHPGLLDAQRRRIDRVRRSGAGVQQRKCCEEAECRHRFSQSAIRRARSPAIASACSGGVKMARRRAFGSTSSTAELWTTV